MSARAFGSYGFKRITSSDNVVTGPFYVLKAVGGAATLATCTVSQGDPPEAGDTILEGDLVHGLFETVQVSDGTVYAYRRGHGS